MKLSSKVLSVIIAMIMGGGALQAALINQNFDGFNVRAYSNATDTAADLGASAWVRDADSYAVIVDAKFGPAGDHALLITNGYAEVDYMGDAVTSGVFSITFERTASGTIYVRDSGIAAANATAISLSIVNYQLKYYDGTTLTTFDQNLALLGTKNELVLNFDATTDTFSGVMNGTTLTAGSGSKSIFNFNKNVNKLDKIMLQAGTGKDFYVDNIMLVQTVPEPTTITLFMISGAGCLLFRRLQR